MLSYSLHNQTMTNLNLNPKNTGEKASHKNKRPTTVSTTKTRTRIIYLLVACLLAVHLFFVLTNSTIGRPWTSTIDFSSSKVNNKYGDHGNNDAMNTTKHSSNKSSPGQRNFTEELMFIAGTNKQEEVAQACNQSGLFAARDLVLPESVTHHGRKIPKTIHITSKSRCLTKPFYDNVEQWKVQGYSVYFHDDDAKYRLFYNSSHFLESWSELPNMSYILACMKNRGAMLADLWRYLIIYEYGGVYVDQDDAPGEAVLKGDPDAVIGPNMDGVLITPPKSPGPPQYFFAFSRKHPLLFYALLETFQNLLSSKDIMSQYVPYVTGGTFTAAWKKVVGLQKTHHGEFNLTGRAGFATNLRGIKHGRGVSNRIVIHEPKWLSGQVEEDYRKAVKITDYNRNFLKVKENMNGVSCFDALYDSHVKKKGNVFDLMVPINYTRKKGKQ